ncbi:hypothetical protein A9179_15420 [Pseudomonas alcaligenes]|uniref:PhnB-like domain-containing protein n=1 Tax=Aquipseudomonas alcaligenes TaxID=43263 RepID=A0ABR7S3Q2_AQUAC|nr:VOC family protein [Pseudomonas alcaligenes]MBC9251662.1 hypothetical protein [Pseudomonas alcaligenes]
MAQLQKITPCLWFDDQGEQAAQLYVSLFDDARISHVSRYSEAGQEVHGRPVGSAMTVEFELQGQRFIALNGGPAFRFSEAVSLVIGCDDQAEVDHFWHGLGPGGGGQAQQCGWLKDRFGLSWQVVPRVLYRLLDDPEPGKAQRVMTALLQMHKLDIAALQRAAAG